MGHGSIISGENRHVFEGSKFSIADNIRSGTYLFYRPYQQCYANTYHVMLYRVSVFFLQI